MTHFSFDARNHISGMAKARVAKFCMQVEYIKSWPWDDKLSPSGRGQGQVTRFLKFWFPIISLESVKLGSSNFVC